MSIKYAVIARDPDMPLCEYLKDDSLPGGAKDAMKDYLEDALKMERNASAIAGHTDYIACTLNETILFGCICDSAINEDKAFRFLKDIKIEFAKLYKGHLEKVHEQQNIKPMCLDKFFKKSFIKVFDNYSTGITQKNLQNAFAKAEEVKKIATDNIRDAVRNMKETENLEEKSQNIKLLSKDFEK